MDIISHCPFDGGPGRLWESDHFANSKLAENNGTIGPRRTRYLVVCLKCKSRGPMKDTKEDALASWNTRRLFPLGRADAGMSSGLL